MIIVAIKWFLICLGYLLLFVGIYGTLKKLQEIEADIKLLEQEILHIHADAERSDKVLDEFLSKRLPECNILNNLENTFRELKLARMRNALRRVLSGDSDGRINNY